MLHQLVCIRTYMQCAKDYVKAKYPEMEDEVVYNRVEFSKDEIHLESDEIIGWDVEPNKVCYVYHPLSVRVCTHRWLHVCCVDRDLVSAVGTCMHPQVVACLLCRP